MPLSTVAVPSLLWCTRAPVCPQAPLPTLPARYPLTLPIKPSQSMGHFKLSRAKTAFSEYTVLLMGGGGEGASLTQEMEFSIVPTFLKASRVAQW